MMMRPYIVTKLIKHEERVWAPDIEAARIHVEAQLGRDWRVSDRVKLVSIAAEPEDVPAEVA